MWNLDVFVKYYAPQGNILKSVKQPFEKALLGSMQWCINKV